MLQDFLQKFFYFAQLAIARPRFALIPALLTILIGGYMIHSMPRLYQSDALLAVEFQNIPTSLVSPTVTNDGLQYIEQRILSRANLIALAGRHGLFSTSASSLPSTQLADALRRQITLNIQIARGPDRDIGSGSVRIGFRHTDAQVAKDVVADLVAQIVSENRTSRMMRASQTTLFLTQEYENVSRRFDERQAAWDADIQKSRESHPARIPALMIELQAGEQELALLDRTIATLDEEIRLYETQLRLGLEQASPGSRLSAQVADAETELARNSLVYSNDHPQIRILIQRLDELKAQALTVQQTEKKSQTAVGQDAVLPAEFVLIAERLAGAKPRRDQSQIRRTDLAARMVYLRGVIDAAPEVATRIAGIDAEKASLQRTMEEARAKRDAARLGERLETGNSSLQIDIIEAPELAAAPVGPRRLHLAVMVFFAAAAAAAAGVFVAHAFDRTVRGSFDLADMLAGSTLVVIPHWTPKTASLSSGIKVEAYPSPP